ncbi:UPF0481 protein At3g47200-like [Glycine soja]|uniref:UPF0481 protein At3g47200-like n=1 Tax=Glycine soja TaxID=3848 RepID=UPI00103F1798|nr:UPF0481 protein At3g47200-like [Glycine soja]KAG4941542.1 hypothetical protein JHK87_045413 [Glycine soja]
MFGDKINQHASKCGTSRNVLSRYAMHLIYRVPPDIRETNLKAYTPRIVSIGPIHKARYAGNEDSIFESMEELKVNYLKAFLYRTQIPMGTFVVTLHALEDKIRSCIKYNSDDFLKMILIVACFIIELFFRLYRYNYWQGKDLVLLNPWMQMQIWRDLIENQLPFFRFLKFKVSPNENECLLDLTYSSEGVLTMPILNVADDSEMLFRNILAFEHCHLSDDTDIITQYLKILDFLINTERCECTS